MSNYSIPAAGPTSLGPMDIFQRFCRECTGFDIDKSKVHIKTCNHGLRLLPQQLDIYEILQGLWRPPTNFGITPTETVLSTSSAPLMTGAIMHAPPSSTLTHFIPSSERGEENEGQGEEEGGSEDNAYIVEPLEAGDQGESESHDNSDVPPATLRTRNRRAAFLRGRTARPPPTIMDVASTRASSPSVATDDEDGDYSTDSEADSAPQEESCEEPSVSDREVTRVIAEGIPASEGDEQRTTKSEEDYDPDTEGDDNEAAPTQLGSRNRPKRAREVWETKRGKTLVPATAEDLVGYPAPAEVFRTIIGSGKSWIEATNATFPVDQQVLKTRRNGKEDWGCRLRLVIPRTGEACWVYNPISCPKALNRDGYIRHVLDSHLGVERASGGSTRQDQIKNSLKRCDAASAATRRGKRKLEEVEDREDDSEPGPSRKRMREE